MHDVLLEWKDKGQYCQALGKSWVLNHNYNNWQKELIEDVFSISY